MTPRWWKQLLKRLAEAYSKPTAPHPPSRRSLQMEPLENRDTPSIVLTTASLPADIAGENYSTLLTAAHGSGQYDFSLVSGTLPAGISLDSAGVLSGIATVAGRYTFAARAMDVANSTLVATRSFALTVTPGSLATFIVSAPDTSIAGAKTAITISAVDSFGNIETGDNRPIVFTTSDGQIVSRKVVALRRGARTLTTSFTEVGTFQIAASSGSSTGTSGSIDVLPGAATKFAISVPTSDVAGTGVSITLIALDAYGNEATGYTGTATLEASDRQIPSPTSIALSAGVGTATITLTKADALRLTAVAGNVKGTSASLRLEAGGGSKDWIGQNVSDSSLAALAEADFARDNAITYSDMLGLFAEVESEGSALSSAALSSLRELASSSAEAALSIPAAVENLATSAVDGDPANAIIASGNLKVGSPTSQLQTLVADWFLGADHPSAVTSYGTAAYGLASGTLFGAGGPSYKDVYQGQMGDCWLLASFGALAASDPSAIQNAFVDEGVQTVNGSQVHIWAVEFFEDGKPHYLTVDDELPEVDGQFFFANQGRSIASSSNVLWVPLLEKAYAQLCASAWNRRPQADAYQSLDSGEASTALPVLTGRAEVQDAYANSELIAALAQGRSMTVASFGNVPSVGIVGDHDYTLLSYDASSQTFALVNPWGWNSNYMNDGAAAPGMLNLSWSQLQQYFALDGDDNPNA